MTRKRAKSRGNRGGKRKKTSGNNENVDRTTEENYVIVDISLKSSKDGQDNTSKVRDSIQITKGVIMPTLDQCDQPLMTVTTAPLSPNTTPEVIEDTPPTMNKYNILESRRKPLASRTEAPPFVSNNNKPKNTANIDSVDKVKCRLASQIRNVCDVSTSESCEKQNIQEQQLSVIPKLRDNSEGVMISSPDKDTNQQQCNDPNSIISPNTSFDVIEGTPPAMNQRKQTATAASDSNNDPQSEVAVNVSHSVDQAEQTTPQASRLLNDHVDVTPDSCNKPLLDLQDQKESVIAELRDNSECVMISSLDKDMNQQQCNDPNSVISPNTSFDVIEGTPPAMNQRKQTATAASDSNNNPQSEAAVNVSHSVDQAEQTTPQASSLLNDHVDITPDSCNKPLSDLQDQKESVFAELRDNNEGVMISSPDKDMNQQQCNDPNSVISPNTFDVLEGTPPAMNQREQAATTTSDSNNDLQSEAAVNVSHSVDQDEQTTPQASWLLNDNVDVTPESCSKPLSNLQEQKESVIGELRDYSEGVMISSPDKDTNQQLCNDPNSVTSPKTPSNLIEGTPHEMNQRDQFPFVVSDNNNGLQSEEAANVSYSVEPKILSAESVISPSVLTSERNDQMEASCSGLVMSKSSKPVSLEEDLFLSDDSVADPDWARPKNKRRRFIIDMNEVPSDESECELPPKKKRTNKTKRWHKRNDETYERNQAKVIRSLCLPYVNANKKLMPAKAPKANPCSCRIKCGEKITEAQRDELCTTYWGLADYNRQKDFLLMNIISRAPALRLVAAKNPRAVSRFYYFTINGQKTRVCEKFFKATLCISNGPIHTAFNEAGSSSVFEGNDKRGKHEPPNKTNQVDEDFVKNHIESFPTMESHYCRKTSSKLYLENNLSISKMYELYEVKCKENNKTPVSANVYRRIFCTQYNYEFHKTKKDQCATCHKYMIAKTENSADLASWEDKYKTHISLKEKSLEAKERDKIRANTDETFNSITMDLEKVLHMPNSNISLLYYLRKINVYNATIYEARSPNEGLCYLWNELNGKKGSDEVGTALSLWISQLPPTIKEISIFTDTCGGQNRNQYLMCLLLYLVQTTDLDVIEHKYLESGHSHMEVDSIHSAIEHQLKILPVYSMNDYCNVVKLARSNRKTKKGSEKKNPYKPIIMEYSDMLDLKYLANSLLKNRKTGTEGENIEWLKIKCLRFEKKNPGIVFYRYDFDSEYKKLDVTGKEREGKRKSKRKGKAREPEKPFDYHDYKIKKAYSSVLPITTAKKRDLLKMCTEKIIPSELQNWYKNLPAKDGTDCLPDHDTQDELQEDEDIA